MKIVNKPFLQFIYSCLLCGVPQYSMNPLNQNRILAELNVQNKVGGPFCLMKAMSFFFAASKYGAVPLMAFKTLNALLFLMRNSLVVSSIDLALRFGTLVACRKNVCFEY